MAELFPKPKLQATVSPSGWRSIKVQTQQAAKSPLDDLAKALGVTSQISQQVAGLQAFEYKQGVKEGEIAAASADLDEALKGFDTVGEDLVEKGLMPRSQLAGYQVGFRKQTGQREAKYSFNAGLQARFKEVELNPENANFDVIDQIIQEEETNSLERLRQAGGAQLALQGFSEYSSEIKDRFKIRATELRDKAIQKYSENGHIEDFNADFGPSLLEAETPEDIGILQNNIKTRMDELTARYKVPRSRVVEMFWNGFAVPNVTNLLVGDDPQPDKAEKILEAILKIDLTGEKGILGNINRPGAQIRGKAVELRSKIQTARNAIESNEQAVARDILDLYAPAALAVAGGKTGDDKLDVLQQGAIVDFLIDAGYSKEEAQAEAPSLIQSQDLNRLKALGLNYRNNDAKKGAWNAATGSMLSLETALLQKSQMVLPRSVQDDVVAQIEDALEDDPTVNVSQLLATGMSTGSPIIDPKVKARVNEAAAKAKQNIWFEGTDAKSKFDKELSKALNAVIDVDLAETFTDALGEDAKRTEVKASSRTRFEEAYTDKLRVLQKTLVNDPDRDSKILQQVPEIIKDTVDKWRDFKTLELQFEEGKIKEMIEETEKPTFPELPKLEEAKEDIDDVLNSWWEDAWIQTYSNIFFTGDVGESLRTAAKRQELKNRLLTADVAINAKDRSVAFAQADFIENQLQTERYRGNIDLINGLRTLRQFYGYRNPAEIKPEDASEVDFRFAPMYDNEDSLLTQSTQAWKEITTYNKSPETLDIENFPIYKLYNEKFGINTVEQLKAFVNTQKAVLSTKNR
jgi:hypothetical protein